MTYHLPYIVQNINYQKSHEELETKKTTSRQHCRYQNQIYLLDLFWGKFGHKIEGSKRSQIVNLSRNRKKKEKVQPNVSGF
jgi:hypothetical protein